MARKKHVRSHKTAGAGKAVKTAGKVSVATNKIAATVAAVAVTGAFGAGAYALTQDATVFNPDGFASAYGKDAQDSQKGFQATTEQTDAQANRHNDASQDKDRSAEDSPSKDAFSDLPKNGSGTTAVAVDANAKPGTSTVVNDGKGDGGIGDGSGGNPSGPVVDNGGSGGGSGDDKDDGDDTPGGNDNSGGGSSTPSTPDRPNNGGGGNGDGGNSGGSSSGGASAGTKPTDNKYIDVRDNIDLIPEMGENEPLFPNTKTNTIGPNFHPSSDEVDEGKTNFYQSYGDGDLNYSTLYVGQKASAWDFFCAIDATFNIKGTDTFTQYFWRCTRSEFSDYSKKYFRIDSITSADGTIQEVGDSTAVVPQGNFTINVSYSFDGASWEKGSVDYSPAPSRVYVINPYVAEGKVPQVLAAISGGKVNLLKYVNDIIGDVSNSGFDALFDPDTRYMVKLFTGWKEASSDGQADLLVNENVFETTGRHVYEPRGFSSFDFSRYRVRFEYYNVNNDGYVDDGWYNSFGLQTLVAVNDLASEPAVSARVARNNALDIPEGVQAVDIEDSANIVVDCVNVPASVIYLNTDSGSLDVREGYAVDSANPNYSSDHDVLASKDGTRYLAVPSAWDELEVSAGVKSVELHSFNSGLKTINLDETDPSKLPDIDLSVVKDCDIIVKNEAMADAAIEKYGDQLTTQSGNSLSVDKTEGKYNVVDGLKMRGHDLVKVLSGASSIVDLSSVKKVCADAFKGVASDTVICGKNDGVEFEEGCFADSSVKYIVCSDEAQASKMRSQLEKTGLDQDAAYVTVRQQSKDGCEYFAADDGHSAVLKAPESVEAFDGTLVAQDDTKITVDAIGPCAFASCKNLKWAVLDEEVKLIGAKAFNGCTALEGLFIGSTDYVTVESNIFSGCNNVAFFASRATQASFSGNEVPSYNAVMYCPTKSDGYTGGFQYFTPESGVADYALIKQADGGYLLYGCNDIDQPWLCLSGYASMSGQINLPSTTTEIFNYSLAGKGAVEGFTVNWSDLDHLGYIDYRAFRYSTLKGDIDFVSGLNVGQSAFEGCNGITSLVARGYGFSAADMSFASCHSLEKVSIESPGGDYASSSVGAAIFEDCPKLASVEFASNQPFGLSLFGYGTAYSFNSAWDNEPKFSGVIKVPKDSLHAYLNEWSYFFAGYSDYDSLVKKIKSDLREANDYTVEPTEQEIRAELLKRLLPAENTLRMLLGAEQVDEVTVDMPEIARDEVIDGCTFSVKDGVATLVSVSAEAGPVVDFEKAALEDCDEVVIEASAFASAPNVKQIVLSNKVDRIESGAFNGLSGLELKFTSASLPDLSGGSLETPFAFGCDGLSISIDFEGCESDDDKAAAEASFKRDLLLNWPMQSLGYEDPEKLSHLYFELAYKYADEDGNVDRKALGLAADELLMRQENCFRRLLTMDVIDDTKDLAFSFSKDILGISEPEKTPEQDEKTPVGNDETTPVPGSDSAGTGNDDESTGDVGGNKESANDNKENDVESSTGDSPAENTGDDGKVTPGSNSAGSAGGKEGESGVSADSVIE